MSSLKKILYVLPEGDVIKLAILLTLMIFAAVIEVAGISMIPAFVAIVADPDRVMQVSWLKPVLNSLRINSERDLLVLGSIALLGVFVLKSVYIITLNYFEANFIFRRTYFVSYRLMRAYMLAPFIFHVRRNTINLLNNISCEVPILTNVLTNLLKMARESVISIVILAFLFAMEPLITMMIISLSMLGTGSFILFNKKKMKEYGLKEQERRAQMIKALNQGLRGIKDARVLTRENEFIERFRVEALNSTRLMAYIRFIQQIPRPVVETTAVLGMLLVAVLLLWQGRSMADIIPILTLFAMATVRMMPSIQEIAATYTNLRYYIVAINPLYEDLNSLKNYNTKFIADRKNNTKLNFKDRIQIRNLRYHYPGSNVQAIDNISIDIKKGEAIAFVGASGAGKTTIVDMILGLFEPNEGKILVDGINIHQNLSAWQRNVGYIPQTIYLADETLRANVAFGLPEDEINDDRIWESIKLAQLESMVKRLPNGLNTLIGEDGTCISGGQRQRLGIARALYHNPSVLVMDEATSALDNITEKQIIEAIESLKESYTLIMIAHRLTTVKNCDTLYFMEEGKIVQKGSYYDLVDSNMHFREMALE